MKAPQGRGHRVPSGRFALLALCDATRSRRLKRLPVLPGPCQAHTALGAQKASACLSALYIRCSIPSLPAVKPGFPMMLLPPRAVRSLTPRSPLR